MASAIGVATITGSAAIGLQAYQAKSALQLEEQRERTSLILLALNAPTNEERVANLKFFRDAGLLDMGKELDKLIADKKPIPFVAVPPRRAVAPRVDISPEPDDCKRPVTDAEMKRFQKKHGIEPSGRWDDRTQAAVEAMEARCGTPYSPSLDFSDPRNSGWAQ